MVGGSEPGGDATVPGLVYLLRRPIKSESTFPSFAGRGGLSHLGLEGGEPAAVVVDVGAVRLVVLGVAEPPGDRRASKQRGKG